MGSNTKLKDFFENFEVAPARGFEPLTKWLTATYSTAELRRNAIEIITKKVQKASKFKQKF